MANPQIEDGYTRIANELLEALAKTKIHSEARQVFDAIMRRTYGFNKKADMISIGQLAADTGKQKRNVVRALNNLIDMKLIIKTDTTVSYDTTVSHDTNKPKIYSINKDFISWVVSAPTVVSNPVRGSVKSGQGVVSALTPTKESITKDNIQKKERKRMSQVCDLSEALRLADVLFKSILKGTENTRLEKMNTAKKEKTLNSWALDIEKLIRIDGQEPSLVEEVIAFCSNDDFWGSNILSGFKLRQKWDALVAKMQRKLHNGNGGNPKFFAVNNNQALLERYRSEMREKSSDETQ